MTNPRVNPLAASLAALEFYYSTVPDLASHEWPRAVVVQALGLCAVPYTTNDQSVAMAAAIWVALPVERRAEIEGSYSVPSEVLTAAANMGAVPQWPTIPAPTAWGVPSASDVQAFSATQKAALKTFMDAQAARVIDQSPRQLLTQTWTAISALRVLSEASPQASDFPLLEDFRQRKGLATLVDAANAVIALGTLWGQTDVDMRNRYAAAVGVMDGATTIAEVQAEFDSASSAIKQMVDPLTV